MILEGICKKLAVLDAPSVPNEHSKKQMGPVFGTVLLHISFAIKHDQALGTEYLKLVKSMSPDQATGIHYAILFSMVKIFRFETQAADTAKSLVMASLKLNLRLISNAWVRPFIALKPVDLSPIFANLVDSAYYGWDEVVAGLVTVAFQWIDTFATDKMDLAHSSDLTQPKVMIVSLAVDTLVQLFQTQEMVRSEMMSAIVTRVLTHAESSSCCVLLLKRCIQACPQGFTKHTHRVPNAAHGMYSLML